MVIHWSPVTMETYCCYGNILSSIKLLSLVCLKEYLSVLLWLLSFFCSGFNRLLVRIPIDLLLNKELLCKKSHGKTFSLVKLLKHRLPWQCFKAMTYNLQLTSHPDCVCLCAWVCVCVWHPNNVPAVLVHGLDRRTLVQKHWFVSFIIRRLLVGAQSEQADKPTKNSTKRRRWLNL